MSRCKNIKFLVFTSNIKYQIQVLQQISNIKFKYQVLNFLIFTFIHFRVSRLWNMRSYHTICIIYLCYICNIINIVFDKFYCNIYPTRMIEFSMIQKNEMQFLFICFDKYTRHDKTNNGQIKESRLEWRVEERLHRHLRPIFNSSRLVREIWCTWRTSNR